MLSRMSMLFAAAGFLFFLFVRASEPITHYYRVISDMSFIIWVPA